MVSGFMAKPRADNSSENCKKNGRVGRLQKQAEDKPYRETDQYACDHATCAHLVYAIPRLGRHSPTEIDAV